MNNKSKVFRTSIFIAIANIFIGLALPITDAYFAYSWTDLNKLSVGSYSACMSAIGLGLTVVSCLSGVIVNKTRSRWGQNRPWLVILPILCMCGCMLAFSGFGGSTVGKTVVLCVAYILAYGTTDLITCARTALYGQMAGGDSDARSMYISYHWVGTNVGMLVAGGAALSLVELFGKGNQQRGFVLAELVITVFVVGGYLWLVWMGRDADPANNKAAHNEVLEKRESSIADMIKGVLGNRCAVVCILSDICRFTGCFAYSTVNVYVCKYVLGDINAMSLVVTISGFSAIVGNVLAPKVIEKMGGRKKNSILFGILTGGSALLIGVFGKSTAGYIICASLAMFFMSFIDSVDYAMYIDAGEYYLNKTGKDTKAFIISMYGLTVKIAVSLAAIVLGAALAAINYSEGMNLTGAMSTKLVVICGATMGIGYILPSVLLKLFHPVSDADMARIIKENAESENYEALED